MMRAAGGGPVGPSGQGRMIRKSAEELEKIINQPILRGTVFLLGTFSHTDAIIPMSRVERGKIGGITIGDRYWSSRKDSF